MLARSTFAFLAFTALLECATSSGTFRASVYEHLLTPPPKICQVSPCSRQTALSHISQVLDIYETQIASAKEQSAEIIVFPEDGLYGVAWTRFTIEPFLEYVPDPRQEPWNPCLNPTKYSNSDAQIRASCLARHYQIFLALNMGSKEPCDIGNNTCPNDGFFYFNTDVLFNNEGELIARYHKQNLFESETFYWNRPTQPEIMAVDTPLGRLGFITCFDILFAEAITEPAIELSKQVDTVLFPTAWTNVFPLFPAISFHSAWAQGNGVNLLASNLRQPKHNRTGSGIYAATGPIEFYHDDDISHQNGKLLIADLNISKPFHEQVQWNNFASRVNLTANTSFESELFHDAFQWTSLTADQGTAKVCHGTFCCTALYQKADIYEEENFALGAFSGMHTAEGRYFLQICVVQACGSSINQCGDGEIHSYSTFQHLSLAGTFETTYVFPQVVLDSIALAPNQYRVELDGRLILDKPTTSGLLTASLFGRWYERDSE